jgi:hypothetical protein
VPDCRQGNRLRAGAGGETGGVAEGAVAVAVEHGNLSGAVCDDDVLLAVAAQVPHRDAHRDAGGVERGAKVHPGAVVEQHLYPAGAEARVEGFAEDDVALASPAQVGQGHVEGVGALLDTDRSLERAIAVAVKDRHPE